MKAARQSHQSSDPGCHGTTLHAMVSSILKYAVVGELSYLCTYQLLNQKKEQSSCRELSCVACELSDSLYAEYMNSGLNLFCLAWVVSSLLSCCNLPSRIPTLTFSALSISHACTTVFLAFFLKSVFELFQYFEKGIMIFVLNIISASFLYFLYREASLLAVFVPKTQRSHFTSVFYVNLRFWDI